MIRASGSVKMLPVLLFVLLGCMQPEPGERAQSGADTPAAAPEGPYVASTPGQVYYRSGCAAAQRLSPANRRTFASAAAAEAAGYRPSTAPGCGSGAAPRPAAQPPEPRPSRRASSPPPGTAPCIVASVSDGDTLTCRDRTRVRRRLPLREPSGLAGTLGTVLLGMSEGYIGELSTLLSEAAVAAIRTGRERIDKEGLDSIGWIKPAERRYATGLLG